MTSLAASFDLPSPALLDRSVSPRATSTSSDFERALRAGGHGKEADEARRVAQQLVAETFIKPVLKQVRETRLIADRFAPGDAERRFGPLLDERIADRMTQREGFPLVDAVADHLMSITAKRLQVDVSSRKDLAA
jgi:Rod binding domain-containing protein